MTLSKNCLTPLMIEHVLAGQQGPHTRRWREHLQTCADCTQRLHLAERQGQAYAALPEAAALRQRLLAEASSLPARHRFRRRALLWAGPVLPAGVILLMARPNPWQRTHPFAGLQMKGGGLALLVLRQASPGITHLELEFKDVTGKSGRYVLPIIPSDRFRKVILDLKGYLPGVNRQAVSEVLLHVQGHGRVKLDGVMN